MEKYLKVAQKMFEWRLLVLVKFKSLGRILRETTGMGNSWVIIWATRNSGLLLDTFVGIFYYYTLIGMWHREGEQYQFNTIERREGLQEYQIKGLHAFSSYEIVVQAYNTIGSGPFSESLVASTLEDREYIVSSCLVSFLLKYI
jgi:hypothetical protein